MFNGTHTVKVKRNRARYVRIQAHIRSLIAERLAYERHQAYLAMQMATVMSLIRTELNLPIPDDELKHVNNAFVERFSSPVMTRPWIKQALKYLSPDFTPEALYATLQGHYLEDVLIAWLRVRWAIIEHVEGRGGYDLIPSNFYAFNNDQFFFDGNVYATKEHSHTSWKLKAPHVMRPELKKKDTQAEFLEGRRRSWWQWFREWSKCDNYQ